MALGVVCHWVEAVKGGYVNKMNERSLQLGRLRGGHYGEQQIRDVYVHNVTQLSLMAGTISSVVGSFRLSSSLLPLADQIDRSFWDCEEVRGPLRSAGETFRRAGTRTTMHPGQFCVLSSDRTEVVENAVRDLSIHAWILDTMGMPATPSSAINVHGGKRDRADNLIRAIKSLPESIRSRLTVENDESAYSVQDLMPVSAATGVPIVFDVHHHTFRPGGMSIKEAMGASMGTWGAIKPLQHLSNTEKSFEGGSFAQRRQHSQFIHTVPGEQMELIRSGAVDVDVEAKAKNLAVLDMVDRFGLDRRALLA